MVPVDGPPLRLVLVEVRRVLVPEGQVPRIDAFLHLHQAHDAGGQCTIMCNIALRTTVWQVDRDDNPDTRETLKSVEPC